MLGLVAGVGAGRAAVFRITGMLLAGKGMPLASDGMTLLLGLLPDRMRVLGIGDGMTLLLGLLMDRMRVLGTGDGTTLLLGLLADPVRVLGTGDLASCWRVGIAPARYVNPCITKEYHIKTIMVALMEGRGEQLLLFTAADLTD